MESVWHHPLTYITNKRKSQPTDEIRQLRFIVTQCILQTKNKVLKNLPLWKMYVSDLR